jgi:hypothetical protein
MKKVCYETKTKTKRNVEWNIEIKLGQIGENNQNEIMIYKISEEQRKIRENIASARFIFHRFTFHWNAYHLPQIVVPRSIPKIRPHLWTIEQIR